jgi:hypothetical protein
MPRYKQKVSIEEGWVCVRMLKNRSDGQVGWMFVEAFCQTKDEAIERCTGYSLAYVMPTTRIISMQVSIDGDRISRVRD